MTIQDGQRFNLPNRFEVTQFVFVQISLRLTNDRFTFMNVTLYWWKHTIKLVLKTYTQYL